MTIRLSRLAAMLLSGVLAISAGAFAQAPSAGSESAASVSAQPGNFTQAQIEQLLAPVALYPDALLAQILMASTYPLEIVEAARWRKSNPDLKEKALEDALQSQAWDPSVKSLTAFPQVLQMMNEKLSWTQQLGDAFLFDQQLVMMLVQKMRKSAYDQGNLQSSKEQTIVVEKTPADTIIKIEPADPQVVYVPTYNPTVVYGTWPYPAYPPAYYYPPGYTAGAAFWTFTAGVIVGSALWGNCNWHGNDIYINRTNYNNFNRTNIKGDTNWSHNVDHRRGVAYKDQRVAQQYNRGASTRDVKAREQFRGKAEAGRADMGQRVDSGNRASTADRSAGGRRDGGSHESAGSRDVSRGGGDFSGGRQASAFGGADHGRQASDFSSRGLSSRQGASSGGRAGASAGGRAGGRAGGGGGRGGRR